MFRTHFIHISSLKLTDYIFAFLIFNPPQPNLKNEMLGDIAIGLRNQSGLWFQSVFRFAIICNKTIYCIKIDVHDHLIEINNFPSKKITQPAED